MLFGNFQIIKIYVIWVTHRHLMAQSDDNSLTAQMTKKDQVRFCEVENTCTEMRAEKRIQRTAWILSHVLRKTLWEHVNCLCPAGWLNEQSVTKHWFQSVRTCPYSWATDRNKAQAKTCFSRQEIPDPSKCLLQWHLGTHSISGVLVKQVHRKTAHT